MNMPRYALVKYPPDEAKHDLNTNPELNLLEKRMGTFVCSASVGRKDRIWFKEKFYRVEAIFHQEVATTHNPGEGHIDAILLVETYHAHDNDNPRRVFEPEKWPTHGG
jgi:hypothetical protein